MKKITFLKRLGVICLGVILSSSYLMATDYCHTPLTSNDNSKTIYITAQSLGGDQYEYKIESDEELVGVQGHNLHTNVSGQANPVFNIGGTLQLQADNKTLITVITSSAVPYNLHGLFLELRYPGDVFKSYSFKNDINWDATCGGGVSDTQNPVMGSASVVGSPTFNSVTLSLNATDDITDPVTHFIANDATNDIVNKALTVDASGNVVLSGLSASTSYNLTITAKDNAGNISDNSANVSFTTTANTSTECAGNDTQASDGTFTLGYIYAFSTEGTDVTIDIELLDTKVGLIAFLWNRTNGFAETGMTHVEGQKYRAQLTGLDLGSQITVAVKFAFSGGMVVTRDFTYTVGNTCGGIIEDTEIPTAFTATQGAVTATSVELLLNATDDSGAVNYGITFGETSLSTSGTSGVEKSYVVTGLSPETAYTFVVTAKDAAGNEAANSPITVNATTLVFPAAPTPIVSADKVISVYSDAYTNLPSTRQDWYGNTFSDILLQGNPTLKNTTICCFGYEFTNKPIDVSGMNYLHVDVYPESMVTPSMSLGITDGGDFMQKDIALTAGQWNAIDVALSDLTGANLSAVNQVGFWDMNGTFYIDNIYFFNGTPTSQNNTVKGAEIKLFPNPVRNSLSVTAQLDISEVIVHNLVGQKVMNVPVNGSEKSLDVSQLPTGNYFVFVKLANGQTASQKIIKL